MNTWAVQLVSKLVDQSKTWEEFGANVAKALMRARANGMREADIFIPMKKHGRRLLKERAARIERGEE